MAELDRAAAEHLKALLTAEGAEILDDPQRLRGLIADRLSRHRRERQALTAALAAGVPQRLRSRQAEMVDDRFRADLSVELHQHGNLDSAAADWAVGAWAVALGVAETIAVSGPSPQTDRARPWYRQPKRLGAVGAAAVIGLFVVGSVIGENPPPPPPPPPSASDGAETPPPTPTLEPTDEVTPSPTAPATPKPTPTPTPVAEDRPLLEWIPVDIRASCQPFSFGENYLSYQDGYTCSAAGVDSLHYASYATTEEMYAAYYDGFGLRRHVQSGACPTDLPSDRTWTFADTPDDVRGRYACYISSDVAVLIWTMDYARVLVTMTRGDQDVESLRATWRDMPTVEPSE